MKTTLLVLIVFFLILFAIGCSVYVVFSIINKIYFTKEVRLMEQYNKLAGDIGSLNMFKLDVLANSNPKIKSSVETVKAQYNLLNNNLKTLYNSVLILDKEVKAFNLKPAQKHIEIISIDLKQSEQDFKDIKAEYERFTQYSDTIANMFNDYIELNEKLKNFYNTKIIYHSDFKKILVLFDAISKTISTIPDASVKFDFKKTVMVWIDLHSKIQALVKAINAVLKFQIVITYLESSMIKNTEIINHSYASIADSDKQVLQRYTATFENSYSKLLKAYRAFDLNKAQAYAIDATMSLNQINNFVTVHTKAADIIAVSLNDINNQTDAILSNKEQIINSVRTIQEYFVKESKVNQWFEDIVDDINTIEKLSDQSKYVSYKTHGQKVSALASLSGISKNIFNMKEEISNLIDNVNDALNKVISSITDLNDLYIYFWQMLVSIKQIAPEDDDTTKSMIALIQNNLKLIDQYTNDIVSQENPDYNQISSNINNIIEQVHQVYGKISSNLTLKNFARKLMVYCNRYKGHGTKMMFDKANELYKAKKYSQCINQLLAIHKKAKNKAK